MTDAIEMKARIEALIEQRNTALDQVAVLVGRLTFAQHRIGELEKLLDKKKKHANS